MTYWTRKQDAKTHAADFWTRGFSTKGEAVEFRNRAAEAGIILEILTNEEFEKTIDE